MITSDKTKPVNESKNDGYGSSHFICQSYFFNDGSQTFLIF